MKWEARATAYAHRNEHVLLFSPEFVEIRSISTGRIVQVLDGKDIRLLDDALVAQRGRKDQDAMNDRIVELVETQELNVTTPSSATSLAWDGWDL